MITGLRGGIAVTPSIADPGDHGSMPGQTSDTGISECFLVFQAPLEAQCLFIQTMVKVLNIEHVIPPGFLVSVSFS